MRLDGGERAEVCVLNQWCWMCSPCVIAGCFPATKALFAKFGGLEIKDGVLQRAWMEPATGEERWQMVVLPRALRETVLKSSHGTTRAGCVGDSKTQGLYQGQIRRDVEEFC